MPTFSFNNETKKNSYGFRIKNAGGDFERFDENSVMLNSHINTPEMTLGNWKNRRVNGVDLLGDSNFDSALDRNKEVEGQVERGFIKGCSMGIGFSFNPDSWKMADDGVMELLKWELMEVSICAVPSNSKSLAMYDQDKKEWIEEDQFKMSFQSLSVNEKFKTQNNPAMEKIILTPAAMSALLAAGVSVPDSASEISRGIEKLQIDLTAEKGRADGLQTKLTEQTKLQAETMVDAAILDEKILKGDREEWVGFAIANLGLATKQIAKLPGKANLSSRLNNSEGDAAIKTVDDFEKLTDEKKLAFKNTSPDAYKALFKL